MSEAVLRKWERCKGSKKKIRKHQLRKRLRATAETLRHDHISIPYFYFHLEVAFNKFRHLGYRSKKLSTRPAIRPAPALASNTVSIYDRGFFTKMSRGKASVPSGKGSKSDTFQDHNLIAITIITGKCRKLILAPRDWDIFCE